MLIEYKINKDELKDLEVFFCDVDGTLINNKGELSQKTIEAVKGFNKKIMPFILISGRNIKGLIRFYKQLELDTPIITLNGSCSFYNNKVINSITIDRKVQKELMDILFQYKDEETSISLFNEDKWYVNDLNNKGLIREANLVDEKPMKEIREAEFYNIPINKVMIIAKEEKCKELVDRLKDLNNDLYIINNYATYIEIFSKGANKAKAIENIQKKMNFDMDKIIAAGDTRIDIPMLELAKYKAVVMNAKEEIKEYANILIPSNEDDGIACLLKEIEEIKVSK